RHVHRADHAGRPAIVAPATVLGLTALHAVENLFAVGGPLDAFVGARPGEELGPAVVAQHVDRLRPVVDGVFVVPQPTAAAEAFEGVLAILQPLLAQVGIVIAEAEPAGNRRRRQGRPATAATAAPRQAVLHAAVAAGGVLEVLLGVLDRR